MDTETLKRQESKVLYLLKNKPETRSSDKTLYREFIETFFPEFKDMSVMEFFSRKIPSYEGITRCRRKLQSIDPELRDEETTIAREEQEQVYREYSRI